MRYAIITETYPPEINGVALTVQGLEQGLRARGHTVDLIRPAQLDESAALTESVTPSEGLTVVRGLPIPRYPNLRFGLPCPKKLRTLWSSRRPDAIYVATEGPLGNSAVAVAKELGIPAITGFHTRFDHYVADYGFGFLRKTAIAWMRRFHNRADMTLVPTLELRHELLSLGFANVQCLRRAVDCERFDPAKRSASLRTSWGLGREDLAVLFVGRIASEKNLDLAVDAYRALQRHRPDARFIWIGDGPRREDLQEANPDFVFTGMLRGEELAEAIASTDLFPFASVSETFGNVTLEAMASGVSVVAFDYGAAHEFLRRNIHGDVISLDDESAFIAATTRLGLDDALRREMGLSCRRAMEALHPEQVAEDLDSLLQQLIDRGSEHADVALAQ